MARTKGPWRWLSKETLVGDHGRRPVVLSANPKGQLVQRNEDGLLRPVDLDHPDMKAIAGAGRLIEAVETFLLLRKTIFPEVKGDVECAALEGLEKAVVAAGGTVPWTGNLEEWMKKSMELERDGLDPGPIGRMRK